MDAGVRHGRAKSLDRKIARIASRKIGAGHRHSLGGAVETDRAKDIEREIIAERRTIEDAIHRKDAIHKRRAKSFARPGRHHERFAAVGFVAEQKRKRAVRFFEEIRYGRGRAVVTQCFAAIELIAAVTLDLRAPPQFAAWLRRIRKRGIDRRLAAVRVRLGWYGSEGTRGRGRLRSNGDGPNDADERKEYYASQTVVNVFRANDARTRKCSRFLERA